MWEISNALQAESFLAAVALGAALCLLYDLFRLDRMIFRRSTVAVVFADILFWVIAAFAVFCLLLLTTNGQVRGFVLLAVLVGFWIWRLTASRLVELLRRPLSRVVRRLRRWYGMGVSCLAKCGRFLTLIWSFLKKGRKRQKKCQKTQKN